MRYDASLKINYDYGGPADHARNLLRLMPRDIPGRQKVSSCIVSVDPVPAERYDRIDFFGNGTLAISFHEPVRALDVTMRARVDVIARDALLDLSPKRAGLEQDVRAVRGLGPDAPHHFLGPSQRVALNSEMTSWAQEALGGAETAWDMVWRVGEALHAQMRFDPGVTDVDTDPLTAFHNRHGVCQDFSHIMIACLRGLGIPAGYVSGFLRTEPPEGQPRLEGADAMHAWVRAWCGIETGWVEFDPTNAMAAGPDHLVVALGRDYADVAPVRGTVRASGLQLSRHSVDVVPLG